MALEIVGSNPTVHPNFYLSANNSISLQIGFNRASEHSTFETSSVVDGMSYGIRMHPSGDGPVYHYPA